MFSILASLLLPTTVTAQVTATNPNGVTNPPEPYFEPVGTQINQTSFSRLLTLNGVDDFCLFGPPEAGPDSLIGNVEPIVGKFSFLMAQRCRRKIELISSFLLYQAKKQRSVRFNAIS